MREGGLCVHRRYGRNLGPMAGPSPYSAGERIRRGRETGWRSIAAAGQGDGVAEHRGGGTGPCQAIRSPRRLTWWVSGMPGR